MNYGELKENLKTRSCRFCSSDKQEPIYENDHAFLTYAIAPYHKDHLLIFPKRHVEKYLDLNENELLDIDRLKKLAFTLLNQLGYETISLLFREGPASGKSIPHVHFHAVPKVKLDPVIGGGDTRKVLTPEEQQDLLQKIKDLL